MVYFEFTLLENTHINWLEIHISDLFGHFDTGLPKLHGGGSGPLYIFQCLNFDHIKMLFFIEIIGYLEIVYIVAQSEEFPVAK